jgi:tetratricopeptide (TPR) repeat protein
MTAPTDTAEAKRLADEEYQAALDRLREHVKQLEEADHLADANSLDRARDAARVFEDRRWVDELPAPKKTHHRGRPVDPASINRFSKWVSEHVGLQGAQTYRLLRANSIYFSLGQINPRPESERTLRPLSKLTKEGRTDEAPRIWRRAIELAEGTTPNSGHVRKALRDHDIATGRIAKTKSRAYQKRLVKDERKRLLRALDYVLINGDKVEIEETMTALKQRLAEFAETP